MTRYFRIEHHGRPRHVLVRNDDWRLLEGDLFGEHEAGEVIARDGLRFLAPVLPSKIVAVGLNYKDHAAEQNRPLPAEPMIFIKPSTAVVGPGDPIVIRDGIGRVEHEAEAGVVIGARASRVRPEDAHAFILGMTCVNDVTARELQRKDVQYTRGKGFDTFAPIGPCVAAGLDFDNLAVECWVNGTRRQGSGTRELIFPIRTLVAFVSSVMTLLPGDIISTGTPAGVGPIAAGDRVTVKVEGVGEITNPVVNG